MYKFIQWTSLRLSFLLMICSVTLVYGQERQVTGRVLNNNGEPLEAVTVKVDGSNTVSRTNSNGAFSIKVPNTNGRLVFNYLGYETQTVQLDGRTVLDIKMVQSSSMLEDVVVVGYDEQKRSDLTGAIGSVKMKDLQKAPVKSFDEALAGRVAGVQVTSSEGQPGSTIDIVIRGIGSITQNVGPLYVIDGMPVESPNDGGLAANAINALDPADIESIDILKDASATAIYGARGGNGVVIITTKRGALSAPTIAYNTYYGFQNSTRRQEVLGPYDFVKLQWDIDSVRTKGLYLQGGEVDMEDYKLLDGINWENQVMRTAPMSNHHLSFKCGTAQTKYSASLSRINQEGVILNSGFNRTQGRITLDQEVNKKLKLGLDASYSNYKN